ncbi:MAG: HDIG domain-containing metalloprotein [Bdellovibrionia bacterium]
MNWLNWIRFPGKPRPPGLIPISSSEKQDGAQIRGEISQEVQGSDACLNSESPGSVESGGSVGRSGAVSSAPSALAPLSPPQREVAATYGSSIDSPSLSLPGLPKFLEEHEQAQRLIALAVSRQATRFISSVTTDRIRFTAEQLKDGVKGKIVGKEGRNARHFQERSGVDLLLNDEPDAVVLSSFDPFRREVARVALMRLLADGRIQPAKIEEALAQARTEVDQQARVAAQQAAQQLGVEKLHPAILRVLGTLKFRHSFGQNQLDHSLETAWLCGSLACELGFDLKLARRAALLHDLGKALDQTHEEGGHALAGALFAEKYGECAAVVSAIAAHHEEKTPQSVLDHLVIAADALSGARPGARHGSTQALLNRSEQMEALAMEIPGVTQAYAVQAGRELRVFVDCQKVSDEGARAVALSVSRRIQDEVRFPGQIQITVLRELRAIEWANRAEKS